MQQIMYDEVPEVVLNYPPRSRSSTPPSGRAGRRSCGGVFYNDFNIDSYMNLKPKSEAEVAGGSSTAMIVVIVVIVVVVAAIVVWLVLRRRAGRVLDEA